jgi:hypothetical protein
MGFIKYKEEEKRKMTEIYAECGGNGSAIPRVLTKIKDELGIVLPKDGRSLRNWQREFQIYPKPKEGEVSYLFPEAAQNSKQVVICPRLMPMEEFHERMESYAGEDQEKERGLLNDIYQELKSGRIKESLKNKTLEELLKIKQMIEESQQKRECHLVKMIEFVDYRRGNEPVNQKELDEKILSDLDQVDPGE